MENVDLGSGLHSDDIIGGSAAVRRVMKEIETVAPANSTVRIGNENGAGKDRLYKAVIALSRSIAGRSDLRSLLSGVAESLRPIVSFDHIGLILHDPKGNAMQGHILNEPGNPVITSLRLPVDQDPAGWVWQNQHPLVVSPVQSETRWPEFVSRARDLGISTLLLVPLTAGNHRLGAFGVSSVAPFDPSPVEIAFLERVASEFAVAVESFLAKQEALRERDRLRTLFDITNALASKVERDELFPAISGQLSNVIQHDYALLTLRNAETGLLDVYALHSTGPQSCEAFKGPFNPMGMPAEEVLAAGYTGIVLSGGPASVYDDEAPLPDKRLFEAGIPLLGICYGMQAMGYLLGGHVVPAERREYGPAELRLLSTEGLLEGIVPERDGRIGVWMSHGDTVMQPPRGFVNLGTTENCPVAAMADDTRRLFAVQFHPEVAHTPQGKTILRNFLRLCGARADWSMPSFVDAAVEGIRRQVGRDRVLCALSGGVDSSVVAVLIPASLAICASWGVSFSRVPISRFWTCSPVAPSSTPARSAKQRKPIASNICIAVRS
jgi:GMP synthase (glutamine-hydrolysing) A subunit